MYNKKDTVFEIGVLICFIVLVCIAFGLIPLKKKAEYEQAYTKWNQEASYEAVLYDKLHSIEQAKDCKTKEETKICTFYNGEEEIEMVVRDYWKTDTGGKE